MAGWFSPRHVLAAALVMGLAGVPLAAKSDKVACGKRDLLFFKDYRLDSTLSPRDIRFYTSGFAQSGDMGYLVAGSLTQDTGGDDSRGRDALIMKLDARGNLKWAKVFWHELAPGDSWLTKNEDFKGIIRLKNFSFVAYGPMVESETKVEGVMMASVRATGKILWKKFFRVKNDQQSEIAPALEFNSISPLSDGTFVGVGNTAARVWDDKRMKYVYINKGVLARFSKTGRVLWAKRYSSSKEYIEGVQDGEQWVFASVAEKDGSLYVQGSSLDASDDGTADHAMILAKLDMDGSLVWVRKYRDLPKGKDQYLWNVTAGGVVPTEEGLLVYLQDHVAGRDIPDYIRVFLMKMDVNGGIEEAWKSRSLKDNDILNGQHILPAYPKGTYLMLSGMDDLSKVDSSGKVLRKMGVPHGGFGATKDGGAVFNAAYQNGHFAWIYRTDRTGRDPWEEYWTKPAPLPKQRNVASDFSIDDIVDAKVFNLRLIGRKSVLAGDSLGIVTTKKSLLSKEGTKLKNRGRYHLVDKGVNEVVNGKKLHRYTLDYKGKVTGIIVAPYTKVKGKMQPEDAIPLFFGTKETLDGYDGDNTFPKYARDHVFGANRHNTVMVEGVHETSPEKIDPVYMNGKPTKIWFPDLSRARKIYGLYIMILNGKRDATVLRYNFKSKKTTLLKLPCGAKK